MNWRRLALGTAVALVLILAGVFWFDGPLYLLLRELDAPVWGWIGVIFDAKVWLGVFFVALIAFYVKKSLKTKINYKNARNRFSIFAIFDDFIQKTRNSYAFFIFCSVLGASIVCAILKVIIGRMRPIFFEALDLTGFYPGTIGWEFNSMPSGHTAASFAGLVMIGLLIPRFKWLTWTMAIIIGASRVFYGAHWPTDVIFGAFIGMVAADVTMWLVKASAPNGDTKH